MWRPIRIWPRWLSPDQDVARYSFSFTSLVLRMAVTLAIVVRLSGDPGVGVGWWLVPAALVVIAVATVVSSTLGTTVSSDEVRVRNTWKGSRRIARTEIGDVVLGRWLNPHVFAVLHNGERQVLHQVRPYHVQALRRRLGLTTPTRDHARSHPTRGERA